MKRLLVIVPTMCFLWANASLATGDLIADGGFDNQQAQTQPERFFAGSGFGGWLVGGQGNEHVDLHYDPLNALEGNQYLFMTHSGADVSQVVMLQPGHNYELHVSASAVRDHGSGQLDIVSQYPSDTLQNSYTIGSALVDENPLVPPFAPPLTWHQYQFIFTAQAEQERLFFRNGSSAYLLIDGASLVEVVPEPSSLSLAGLVIVGLISCRNRGRRT